MSILQFEGVCRGHYAIPYFPFQEEHDYEKEAQEYLAFSIGQLNKCLFSKEINNDLFEALRVINRYCHDVVRFDMSQDTFAHLVQALWSFAFETEELGTKWLKRILNTLSNLFERSFLFDTDCMELPWRPAFNTYKNMYWVPRRLPPRESSKQRGTLEGILLWARRWFSEESIFEIHEEARPYLCGFDTSLSFGTEFLRFFLPLDLRSRSRASPNMLHFLDEQLALWPFLNRHDTTFIPSIRILQDLIISGVGKYDPAPLRKIIIRQILQRVRDDVLSNTIKYDDPLSFCFVFLCRPNDEGFWTMASELIHILKPLTHPSMTSASQVTAFSFVVGCVQALSERRTIESKALLQYPDDAKLSHDDYERFVMLLKDIIFMGINSKSPAVVEVMSYCTQIVSKLAPKRFLPAVADEIIPMLQSEENHRVTGMLSLMSMVTFTFFSPVLFPSCDTYLLPLLEGVLPGIDANDTIKTLQTFRFLTSVFSTVVLVDCSSQIPNDASDEDVAVLEATAQFEQWCTDFLDAVFRLSEDTSGKALGGVLGVCGGCIRVFFHQLSPALRTKAIEKTAKWVLSTSNFQASIPSHLCKAAAISDTPATVSLLLEPIANKIMEQALHLPSFDDEKAEVVKRDHVLNFNLNLFLHILIVPYPGIIAHVDLITRVFSTLFNTRSRRSTTVATDALERFLSSLTTVRLVDKRSVDVDVWSKIETDPVSVFNTRFLSSSTSLEDAMTRVWARTSCGELLDGSLKFEWVAPSSEQLHLAGTLVGMFLDPAHEYIRSCAIAENIDDIDDDRMRMSLSIIGRFAESNPVAPFSAGEGADGPKRYFIPYVHSCVVESLPCDHETNNMDGMDQSEDGATATTTASTTATTTATVCARERRKVMRDDVASLLKWLLEHKQNDMMSITRCIATAGRVLFGKKTSQGFKSDSTLGRNMQWITPTRSAFASIIDQSYVRRVEKAQSSLIEHEDDLALVDVIVECLCSRYEAVRNAALRVLDKWIAYQPRETGYNLIDSIFALWESAPKLADFDDAKAVILGCMQTLCRKFFLPMLCRSYPRVVRLMRACTACLSVSDDQVLFDSLNICVENVVNNLALFVRPSTLPKDVLRHTTHALMLVSQKIDIAGLEEEIARAVDQAESVLHEYGDTLVRDGQSIILYCLEEFDNVKSSSWKVKLWFARLMTVLLLEKHYLHPQAIHFLMFHMTSGTPQLRALCRGAIAIILYYLKVRSKKIAVKFTDTGPVVVNDGDDKEAGDGNGKRSDCTVNVCQTTFGHRADSSWIMPTITDNMMMPPSKSHIYIDKPYLGWLAWPQSFKTYAPERDQDYSHLTGRHSAPTPPITPIPSAPHSPTTRRWSDGFNTFPDTPKSPGKAKSLELPLVEDVEGDDDDVDDKISSEVDEKADSGSPDEKKKKLIQNTNTNMKKDMDMGMDMDMDASKDNINLEATRAKLLGRNGDEAAVAMSVASATESKQKGSPRRGSGDGKRVSRPGTLRLMPVMGGATDDIYLDCEDAVRRCRFICEAMMLDDVYLTELVLQLASDSTALLYSSVSNLIKGFARIYGIELMRPMFAAMKEVPNANLPRTHSRLAGMVSGLVRGSKHWPLEDRAALWEFMAPFLTQMIGDIPQGALSFWADCVVDSVCEHDPRRSHHLTNYLLSINFGPGVSQFTAIQRHTNSTLLKSLVSELSWRGHNLAKHVISQVQSDLDNPYDLVRRGVGKLIATCHVSLYTNAFDHPYLENFMRTLLSPLTSAVQANKAYLDEDETVRAKMVLSVLQGCSSFYGGWMLLSYVIPHMSVLTVLPEKVQDHEFTRLFPVTLAKITRKSDDPLLVRTLCNTVEQEVLEWHAKVRVLRLLPSAAWYLLPDKYDFVLETVVAHLTDEHIDVQSTAKASLAGLCQSGLINDIHTLIEKFKKDAATKVRRVKRKRVNQEEIRPENMPHTAEEKMTLRRRHAGVLGLSALVLAHPYNEPEWLLPTLLVLVPHCHDIDIIRNTANKTMSEFWRTHKEMWHVSKEQLTQDQQEELRSVLISPSYYA
eukprot:m.73564 g.73564  ORF g.73564 m.73564 type:complete len:2029 (-) comp8423_c1_seq4:183-6269(-)